MHIDLKQLWREDIAPKQEFADLALPLFSSPQNITEAFPVRIDIDSVDYPPVFIFYEERGDKNLLSITDFYGGGGSNSATYGVRTHREIINLGNYVNGSSLRGPVLHAFCELEFVVDVLICIAEGVFDKDYKYSTLRARYNYFNKPNDLCTFNKRLDCLINKMFLSQTTYDLLKSAKSIRDALAHQYLPLDNYGVTTEDTAKYGGFSPAINSIYNGAWFYLQKDHNEHQVKVAKWLLSK